jgi:hypothetical protein
MIDAEGEFQKRGWPGPQSCAHDFYVGPVSCRVFRNPERSLTLTSIRRKSLSGGGATSLARCHALFSSRQSPRPDKEKIETTRHCLTSEEPGAEGSAQPETCEREANEKGRCRVLEKGTTSNPGSQG